MAGMDISVLDRAKSVPAAWLFFRRALRHPLQVASPLPSSPSLARLVVRVVGRLIGGRRNSLVVEIGGGTGVITRALLQSGVAPERLIVIEIDQELADYLRETLPEVTVITGDAARLAELLPAGWRHRVAVVISGIPMTLLSTAKQGELVRAMQAVLAPDGHLLQYTFSLASPVRGRRLGLICRRLGIAFGNMPPASVWSCAPGDRDAAARPQ